MKKTIIAGLMIAAFAMPSFSYAQVQTIEETRHILLLDLIKLLQEQVAILVAQQEKLMETENNKTEKIITPVNTQSTTENLGGIAPDIQIDVSIEQKATDKNGEVLPEGHFALKFSFDGDWDMVKLRAHRPDGTQSAGFGYTSERGDIWLTSNILKGVHTWEVSAVRCSNKINDSKCSQSITEEVIKSGSFEVE